MKLVLDEGLSTEIELPIDNCYEHFSVKQLNAQKTIDLSSGVIPDISGMYGRTSVTSLTLYDKDDEEAALIGNYTVIDDFTTSRTDTTFTYTVAFRDEG